MERQRYPFKRIRLLVNIFEMDSSKVETLIISGDAVVNNA